MGPAEGGSRGTGSAACRPPGRERRSDCFRGDARLGEQGMEYDDFTHTYVFTFTNKWWVDACTHSSNELTHMHRMSYNPTNRSNDTTPMILLEEFYTKVKIPWKFLKVVGFAS